MLNKGLLFGGFSKYCRSQLRQYLRRYNGGQGPPCKAAHAVKGVGVKPERAANKEGGLMKNSFFILFASAALLVSPLSAESWQILGPQALGMGGAFTAVAKGNLAQHWNPGGLGQEKNVSGFQMPIGGRFEFTGGLLGDARNLSNIASRYEALQSAQKSGGGMDTDKMAAFFQGVAALDSLNRPGKGALIDMNAGVNIKINKFVLSVNNYISIGATPFVDTSNIGLGGVSGVPGSGVVISSANVLAPVGSAAQQNAATAIASAIGAGGYSTISQVICGSPTCLSANGIGDAAQLGNALVNVAVTAGASDSQITDAATAISLNAPVALPVLAIVASTSSYANNASNLTLRGASFTELALGFSKSLFLPGLAVGVNLKVIQGNVGYAKFQVLQKEAGASNFYKDFTGVSKTSLQPGLDLGVYFDMNKTWDFLPMRPRVGAVGRNINRPKFDQPSTAIAAGESSKYALDPQVRMGLALSPFNFWTLAADVDLTNNATAVPGFKSRMFNAGTEINVFNRSWLNIPLRAGLMKNIAASNSRVAYTAGAGFNFLHVIVDLGGSLSAETESFKDDKGATQKIPANASLAAQLAFLF